MQLPTNIAYSPPPPLPLPFTNILHNRLCMQHAADLAAQVQPLCMCNPCGAAPGPATRTPHHTTSRRVHLGQRGTATEAAEIHDGGRGGNGKAVAVRRSRLSAVGLPLLRRQPLLQLCVRAL